MEDLADEAGGTVDYDVNLECEDGSYQMDVVVRFPGPAPLGEVVVLVDAKRRTRVVRDDVAVMAAKVRKCGADVGVIVASGPFQSGAVATAKKERVRIWTLVDGRLENWNYTEDEVELPPPTEWDLEPAILILDEQGSVGFRGSANPRVFVDDLLSVVSQ